MSAPVEPVEPVPGDRLDPDRAAESRVWLLTLGDALAHAVNVARRAADRFEGTRDGLLYEALSLVALRLLDNDPRAQQLKQRAFEPVLRELEQREREWNEKKGAPT